MARKGYRTLTLNRKMLQTIEKIKEDIKTSVAVPIELKDSNIVETALCLLLETLQKKTRNEFKEESTPIVNDS